MIAIRAAISKIPPEFTSISFLPHLIFHHPLTCSYFSSPPPKLPYFSSPPQFYLLNPLQILLIFLYHLVYFSSPSLNPISFFYLHLRFLHRFLFLITASTCIPLSFPFSSFSPCTLFFQLLALSLHLSLSSRCIPIAFTILFASKLLLPVYLYPPSHLTYLPLCLK